MEDQIGVVRKNESMWFMAVERQNDVIFGAEGKNDVVHDRPYVHSVGGVITLKRGLNLMVRYVILYGCLIAVYLI